MKPAIALLLAATTAGLLSGAATGQSEHGDRRSFAGTVEKRLLSMGNSAEVALTDDSRTLFIFADLDKAYVYLLISEGKVLDAAHARGFHKVDFFDRGPNGRWVFDLRNGAPSCDIKKRLCR